MSESSRSNGSVASGGVGFLGLLTLLFVGLKLTDHIDWSWIWVLSPVWIPPALFVALLGIAGAILLLVIGVSALLGAAKPKSKSKSEN